MSEASRSRGPWVLEDAEAHATGWLAVIAPKTYADGKTLSRRWPPCHALVEGRLPPTDAPHAKKEGGFSNPPGTRCIPKIAKQMLAQADQASTTDPTESLRLRKGKAPSGA